MRRNASTVVVLPGPVPAEILAAVGRSMNVALIRPDDTAGDNGDAPASWGACAPGRVTEAASLPPRNEYGQRRHAAGRPGGSWPARVCGAFGWRWSYQMVMSEALRAVYQAV